MLPNVGSRLSCTYRRGTERGAYVEVVRCDGTSNLSKMFDREGYMLPNVEERRFSLELYVAMARDTSNLSKMFAREGTKGIRLIPAYMERWRGPIAS